jgi:aspartate carbamoyltransferase catalytic subunit
VRHLLSIADLGRADLERLLDAAEAMERERSQPLAGATVVNLFLEPSTRTRVSFETAAKRLGADVVNVSAAASSVVKGESLADTGRTI